MELIKAATSWIIRRALKPEIAQFLLDSPSGNLTADLKSLTEWIVLHGTPEPPEVDPFLMPLACDINSNIHKADFLDGEDISIMKGSFVSPDSSIGAYSYVGFNCHITRASIGRYVSIANDVAVGPGEHATTSISTSSMFYENPYEQLTKLPCSIGHDAWIGAGSIIRRGISVGIGAVVGANSFVNQDVPPFAIVAGSPARLLGYRFNKESIDVIMRSSWWDQPIDTAREVINSLQSDIEKTL
ncbi:CatB-related O-acetyltransferase [Herbaspirillum rhizosphaerae]|uniref:CatB-related O-acetyltransferase n=1 Tax=Herbaspirillum rhizosphaerae TaxID=346179 RepID=A0ABW8Z8G9_9BURK